MVLNIADIILRIAKEDGKQLTPMQLMKLTYISNGWSLAVSDRPLFDNRIEAWKYGPVMPELYQATKSYGRDEIPLDKVQDGFNDLSDKLSNEVDFLRKVYNLYKDKNGIELSSLTHMHGTPWHQVYDGYSSKNIPQSMIKKHYEDKLDKKAAA